ncbi:MAG TPA: ABC transporter ATP-binding protein [Candidatus Saccharimonadales bacterium]|nr:ABC transporter ATP-binding protein [Candidatus Saccharimonadales bacterium]
MPEETAIRVENVSKDFVLPHEKVNSVKSLFTGITKNRGKRKTKETQHALKDISFDIKQGEFFGIVGRNGSGKSTMLKILAGIYQPTKGKVYTRGKLVPFIELGVGFNPELTGRENVYLNGAMLGFSEKEVDGMYDSIVKFAELERFMDQKLKNYSSGMQVRLAFSMAIRAEADILLIDEVLAVGDADFQKKCYDYFKSLKKDKKTVVFVSHDMTAIREHCDRAALIEDSLLADIGEPEEVARKYTKLFAHEEPGASKKNKRWGDKRIVYKEVKAELVDNQKNILLRAKVHAKGHIPDPTYGFTVFNEVNQPILGTNTKIEQAQVKPLTPGQQSDLAWKFPNIFNEGKFYIELVAMYNSVTEVADWWEEAVSFSVTNERKTPYIINPPSEFEFNE